MNEKQLDAVKSLDNTLLIAGAGSGKTYTIINKVDYLIDNNYYKEDDLLIISFTNESVNDLKRIIKYPHIDIYTFHKLGLNIIQDENCKIAPSNYLDYIINEYLYSYGKYNRQTNKRIKRILKETNLFNLQKLIKTFINLYKSNYEDIYYLFDLYQKKHFITKDYLKIISDIYTIYKNELESTGLIDFNDMIQLATKKINSNIIKTKYKYIIIDEFQDTSLIRFKLIEAIIKQNDAKLFAVGDDYQSIYRFNGCNLNIFLNLNKYIPNIKTINLEYNYRNNQSLINIANNFIMKNKKQIRKNTICIKDTNKPIKIILYKDHNTILKKILPPIKGNILILGRNNNDKNIFNVQETDNIHYLTIHSSKGLEEDNVVIVNLENSITSLPSKIICHHLLDLIIEKDKYPYEEERRLFYVALTRAKNNVYLLVPYYNPSPFIKEIYQKNKKYVEIIKY